MSWSDIFPILTDDHVDAFEAQATKKVRRQYDEWFAVKRVINPRDVSHIVSTSLFWKNIRMEMPQIVIKNRSMLMNAGRKGKLLRFDPWKHYVEPLLKGAHWLHSRRKDAAFRVYLAADMEFLVPDLVAAGCEVRLMKSNSLAHNPGAMWRLLAFEDEGKLVTLVDADRADRPEADMARTEEARRLGLGWWRVPVWGELNEIGNMNYRPMLGCQLGANVPLPIGKLMKALIWHTEHQTIATVCHPPGCKPARVHGSIWPDYGYDEWFLQAAVYPRAAFEGILTFTPAGAVSRLLPLDIEYTNWANSNSAMVYFGSAGAGCCGPDSKQQQSPAAPSRSNKAVSKILPLLMRQATKARVDQPKVDRPGLPRQSVPQATLVVARYKENLSWLKKLDARVRVVVYNKGPEITDKSLLKRIDQITTLPNRGREADTYLAHLESGRTAADGEWTIFTQGDPFPHSPDFLKLLEVRKQWKTVQPLTYGYVLEKSVPPKVVCDLEREEWIGGLRVRSELMSLKSITTLGTYDRKIHFGWDYADFNRLPLGWSVAGHFLEDCGLMEKAAAAWKSYVGRFAYGAIFAVKNNQLDEIPVACIPRMRAMNLRAPVYGFIFERMWLHLFGLPFSMDGSQASVVSARKRQQTVE